MIRSISIENFYSIAGVQELDFSVPNNAPDTPAFLTPEAWHDARIPSVIGFFGPNASGKSTVLRALNSALRFVLHSFSLDVTASIPFFNPYRRQDWWTKPSKITVEFEGQLGPDTPRFPFRYTLHVNHENPDKFGMSAPGVSVLYEYLGYAPKGTFRRLFERHEQDCEFGQEFQITNSDPRTKVFRKNASILSTLAQFNHELSLFLLQTLATVQSNIVGIDKTNHGAETWLVFFASNKEYLDKLNKEWRRLDIGLEEMSIEMSSQGRPLAKFKHVGLDAPIFLEEESIGTRKFIGLFPMLQYVLQTGATAIIDELDTDLHPVLIPELFRWFGDKERNPHNAQLLFTAHNASLLDDLEKEQVFLTEKQIGEPTCVYAVKDIRGLRREPSLTKKYLSGELGGIPHIG